MRHQGHANGLNRQLHPIDLTIGQEENGAAEPPQFGRWIYQRE